MKDWRGTEIEVGSKVIAHAMGKRPQRAVGEVIKIHDSGLLTLEASDKLKNYSWSRDKIVISPSSVTVLTEDLFPDLVERVATLEGDVEYYKSEIARTW